MRLRRVIRTFATLYVWGFIIYQITPVEIIPYTNYAPAELSPKPVLYSYSFAYDVKTAFSNHAGSIKNLLKAMDERGIDFAFGDFPHSIEDRLFPSPSDVRCSVIRNSEVSFLESALHFLLDTLPKRLAGVEGEELLSRKRFDPAECYLLAHDRRVLVSTSLGIEFPPYGSVLGGGRNIFLSREVLIRWPYVEDFLKGGFVLLREGRVSVFAYSERSFYLPGEKTVYPFRYVISADFENPLILVFKDRKLKGIFSQRRLNLFASDKGSYSAQILTYKFKIHILYFGVRTTALASSVGLM